MRVKCNSCGATYQDTRDGTTVAYIHACPEQLIETYAVCDDSGKVVKPATFKPTPNPRNENLQRDPNNSGKYAMISEGSGVTEVE